MSTTTTELLSPAGDFETVRAACRFGADAVYLGGPALQMRAQKAAFTMDGIREAAAYLPQLLSLPEETEYQRMKFLTVQTPDTQTR